MSQGNKGEEAVAQWVKFSRDGLTTITDIELATLKIHIVIEGALRYLLAARLNVSESSLERLRFAELLELGLGGMGNSRLLLALRALNAARNKLSHRLKSADVHKHLGDFVREIGYMDSPKKNIAWPTTSTKQLRVLKEAYSEAAFAVVDLAVTADIRSQP